MWLNHRQTNDQVLYQYRESLLKSYPNHVVIDNLFNEHTLDCIIKILNQAQYWETQKHTYSALYVDHEQWQKTKSNQRFVQRDVWQKSMIQPKTFDSTTAQNFLSFLRKSEFMSILSRIFNVALTDTNIADPEINTNYFRLGSSDFVKQHADDSPGRKVCMLLYLNKSWDCNMGGELVFAGKDNEPISIPPLYNRCVLFDPSSLGSEHWVKKLNPEYAEGYRYNVTSWYWSE